MTIILSLIVIVFNIIVHAISNRYHLQDFDSIRLGIRGLFIAAIPKYTGKSAVTKKPKRKYSTADAYPRMHLKQFKASLIIAGSSIRVKDVTRECMVCK